MNHDPLARLFSAIANWTAAVVMSTGRVPVVEWGMATEPRVLRWRVRITVDGERVFDDASRNAGGLAIDAERAFRAWTDARDQKENEARLGASLTEMQES